MATILYIERLELFLIANEVTDDALKRATLLSVIGLQTDMELIFVN